MHWSLVLASLLTPSFAEDHDVFHYNSLLGRGVNLGNALEAPREGDWGLVLEAEHFRLIKQAGFQSIRVPIRWSAHARGEAPFEIDAAFFKRVDWVIEQALANNLTVVINVHHFEEICREPEQHFPRLLSLWRQIAQHCEKQPRRVFFELLNEPQGKLDDDRWNRMIPQLLGVIRESNPRRVVIVGPASWNNLHHLARLRLPAEDRWLIATFHYYSPSEFTHQGAPWTKDSKKWLGTTWTATPKQTQALHDEFDKAAAWAKKENRPLYLGEFGAYSAAAMESRARWTQAVASEAEKRGMSWSYWEFAAGFGVYDRTGKKWHQPLLRALVEKEP